MGSRIARSTRTVSTVPLDPPRHPAHRKAHRARAPIDTFEPARPRATSETGGRAGGGYDGSTPAPGTTVPQQWLPTNPPLRGDPSAPDAGRYAQVINQFAVGANPRYTPQGDNTYCNIFAWDVMSAMGAPLPHWVNTDGSPANPGGSGAYELNADGVNDWLNQHGSAYGWREVSADEAQALANQGYPAVVSYNSGDASPGHIAVVRPGELSGQGPEIAQAGGVNTNDTHVGNTFGSRPVQYFVYEGGAKPSTQPGSPPAPSAPGSGGAPSANCVFDGGVTYDPNVEQLQRALVKAGYMTQAQMDTGPGYYGARTQAAIAALQRDYGIADDGSHYGPKTRAALNQALAKQAGSGAPSSGSPSSGSPTSGAKPSSGTPSDANGIQRWNVPYINQLTSDGSADDWNAQSNCGPTTMAMIAKGLGYGRGQIDGDLVNHFDQVAGVGSDGVGYDGIAQMAKSCGFSTKVQQAPTASWVKAQLAQGKLVAANGDRAVTLENENPPYASGSATGGHWIAVVGTTKDGNFLVEDPSTTCKELSPAELERFFRAHGDDGGWAVAIGNGKQGANTGAGDGSGSTPASPSAPTANCVFDGGVTYDPNVEQLQRALVKNGFMTQAEMDTGPGHYGPRTQAAVKALQDKYGIADDGSHYGPQTRAALNQELARQAPPSKPSSKPSSSGGTETVDGVKLSKKDAATARKVDALLDTYANSQMKGMGGALVAACRKERVPLDLALAQLGQESTFMSDGLSVPNQNPGNLRFASWETQFGGEPGQGGFTRFPSTAQGIRAYVHLLGSSTYRSFVDARDWAGLVHVYAPSSDGNDEAEYARHLTEWTAYFADKVGIDANWVNEK